MMNRKWYAALLCILALLLCLSPVVAEDSQALQDSYNVDIYEPETAIPAAPTVIAQGMTELTDKRPATVLLVVAEKEGMLYTTNAAGEAAPLEEQLLLLRGLAMPMLQVEDANTAAALRDKLLEMQLSNAFVLSGDAQLLKTVCTDNMYLRPVLDLSVRGDMTVEEISRAVFENSLTIVMLDESQLSQEMTYQLQQRFMTVFARTSPDVRSLHTQILSGVNGVVTANWQGAIAALESYTDTTIVRPAHVVAHRGNPEAAPDNTLRAIVSAAENGADIIEIDVRMTKDGVLILCHDKEAPLAGYTKYAVPETELSVLQSLEIADARAESGDRLITLEEAFRLIKEQYPHVVLELDLKDRRIEVVQAIRALAEECGVLGNMALLSSNMSLNAKALKLPMGCAVINSDEKSGAVRAGGAGKSAYLAEKAYRHAGGYLCQGSLYFSTKLIEYMKHLGVTSWVYTMNTARDMDNRFLQGYSGMTTNVPAHGKNYARYLKVEEVEGVRRAVLHMYDGTTRDVTAECEEVKLDEGIVALRCAQTLTNRKTYYIYSLPLQ